MTLLERILHTRGKVRAHDAVRELSPYLAASSGSAYKFPRGFNEEMARRIKYCTNRTVISRPFSADILTRTASYWNRNGASHSIAFYIVTNDGVFTTPGMVSIDGNTIAFGMPIGHTMCRIWMKKSTVDWIESIVEIHTSISDWKIKHVVYIYGIGSGVNNMVIAYTKSQRSSGQDERLIAR